MKRLLAFVPIVVSLFVLVGAQIAAGQAQQGICYATITQFNSGFSIATVDLATGEAAVTTATNASPLPGLAVNSSGQMYATTNTLPSVLYTIEPSGATTVVGSILDSGGDIYYTIGAIAFDESDVLYGVGFDVGAVPVLLTINTGTAVGTTVSAVDYGYAGLAFDEASNLFFASGGEADGVGGLIVTIDKSGAQSTIGYTGYEPSSTTDLAFDDAGVLYGLIGGGSGSPNLLVEIDKASGVASNPHTVQNSLGDNVTHLSGFTCFNPDDGGGGDDITVEIDIRPASCPNELNTNSNGNILVAVLGTGDFDVTTVDVSSLSFEGLTPDAWWYEDLSRPSNGGESCDCNSDGPDGYPDLILRFKNQDVLGTIVEAYEDGDPFTLSLEGNLDDTDSTPLSGDDCVNIKIPGKGSKADLDLAGLEIEPVPTSFALEQNYPNPFNPTTSIGFSLPNETFVELSVYNAVGQRVATLVSQSMPAGRHQVQWDATSDSGILLSSGLYIYRISAGEFVQTQKMLLLE